MATDVAEGLLSLPLKRLDFDLSPFTPLEYGGAVVGWVGPEAVNIPAESRFVKVMMDGAIYRLANTHSFGYPAKCHELNLLWHSRFEIVLNLPTDSVDLSPSGGKLVFTERTNETIDALAHNTVTLLHHHAQRFINSQASRTEALSTLAKFAESSALDLSGFTWRGITIPLESKQRWGNRGRNEFAMANTMHFHILNMRGMPPGARAYPTPFKSMDPYDFFERKRVEGNHFVNVVVSSEAEYAEAVEVISRGASSYKSACVEDDNLLMVVLSYREESILEWLGIKEQLSLAEFKSICSRPRRNAFFSKIRTLTH